MKFEAADCLLAMGRRGCGKSHLVKGLQLAWPKRIIFDSLGEYAREFKDADKVSSFDGFCKKMQSYRDSNAKAFVLIYSFNPDNALSEEEFDELLRVSYYFGNVQIVIEEVQLYSNPHYLPHWLKQCLLTGRHQGLSLLFTTQRPGELHKTILSQCHHIFCGQIIEGNDLRYISSFFGDQAEKIPLLPKRKFLWRSDAGISETTNDF